MKKETLDEVVTEAQRFIRRAKELKAFQADLEGYVRTGKHPDIPKDDLYRLTGIHFNLWFPGMSKHTAAVRRSSLDLTHALAKLRKDE